MWHQDLERQIKWQRITILVLAFVTICLIVATAALGVRQIPVEKQCGASTSSDEVSDVPEAPPAGPGVGRRSGGLVVVPIVAGRTTPLYPTPLYPITNGTNITTSPGKGECEAGSVWGGQMLDDLNHGYMPLMQKALSVSPPGAAGEIQNYHHTALRSVFRCGESMDFGQLEVVYACKSGYIVKGEDVECDEGGSYGNSTSASA